MSTSAEEQDLEKSYRALQSPNATAPTQDKLRRALEYIVRVGTWTGTDGIQYTSQECRIARQALAATQEQPDNYNSKLADELQTLCCAETEGKFFDCVTDNIQTIIAALRATQEQRGGADDRRVEAAAKAYITARCEQGHGIDYSIRQALQAANAVTSSKSDAQPEKQS